MATEVTWPADVSAVQDIVRLMRQLGAEPHPLWAEFRVYTFWGASTAVLWVDGIPVSIISAKIGKRKKNVWEPYLNWYGAYTLPSWRRQGYATRLFREMEDRAQAAGCRRVKSLAASSAGLALHASLGHQAWGENSNGEILIDAPLRDYEYFYSGKGAPPSAILKEPLGKGKLKDFIKRGLRYDKAKA